MFKVTKIGRPKPAERARARFNEGNKTFYMYMPQSYREYKSELIQFFNQYENDPNLQELFDRKKIIYGLSVKLIFRFKGKGYNPFYALRPDIDNLFKAVTDSLFESNINLIEDGYKTNKKGELLFDQDGKMIKKYKQKIDDSRICHTEQIKLRVDTEEEESLTIIIKNIGKEDID
ncbi:RusA family crossover junction endodeoxyribonuclease [Listeria sp. ILCC797]|uniref:RusA family crossover junction endodeoxyribonuclease n=1 Tax=Listeria sp. ILCC797 TaxID=1918333 RepID=UPI000B587806|nr:RusA family crossover junction endodeoxyribonuclease [Listeria sp. ILCC797]